MKKQRNRLLLGLVFMLIEACRLGTVNATEGGGSNYLPGFYGDFGMAIFPGPGTYFNNFFAAYRDQYDDTGTLLEMPGILHVSEQHWLGGEYVSGLFPALLATRDVSGQNDYARVALGDFYFVPGGLHWQEEAFSVFIFEGVVAPTGYYRKNDFNTGRNYWTFDHNALLTFNFPGNNELSMAIGYMNNLENPATDYQSGDEFHFDYHVGHYLNERWAVGLSGSHYRQVTADAAPAETPQGAAVSASSIGPVLMYTPKIGDRDVSISLKWLYEFEAEGRKPQEYLLCRLMLAF